MVRIRLKHGVSYLEQKVGSAADAIRFLVLVRNHGMGLSYNINDKDQIIWVKSLKDYCEVMNHLNNIHS